MMNRRTMIVEELRKHAPFTLIGTASGVVLMFLFRNLPQETAHSLFYVFHPAHVVLSALVTASMYRNYKCKTDAKKCNIFSVLLIGYVGAIGVATLSDSLIPYFGESLLGMHNHRVHIGFIEKWWLINPLAILGITIAYFKPSTKFPHFGHVLLSTWASLFHVMMAKAPSAGLPFFLGVFFFLFIAVWLPCCISDIIFPLLFVRPEQKTTRR
ncbi:MAG: hypothetical protein GY858_10320 [Candidatus Omnitrophica bacterium]|nr:hypothetical protein [Candidatus Omnitrophota bacterium]